MLTDLSHVADLACLEQALLADLHQEQELTRLERSFENISSQLDQLIKQMSIKN